MVRMKQEIIKNVVLFIIFLFFLIILLVILYNRPHNYEISYKVDNYIVKEKYIKKTKIYEINIIVNDINFNYLTKDKYINTKKLISEINIEEKNNYLCIFPKSKELSIFNLCYKDGSYIAYNYFDENNNKPIQKKYKNINIYDLNSARYLLWNYDSFIYINDSKIKDLTIDKKDIYSLKNVYQTDKYLFIPKQNDYSFKKAYIIDSSTAKIKTIKTSFDLYFDSYYLGDYKNSIYFVDRKNKQEYEINLKKNNINKINGKILNNEKWNNISITKLINNNYSFNKNRLITYEIADNDLYAKLGKYQILIADNIDLIVKENIYSVYYIKKDILYCFNLFDGNKKIMQYSEWLFNNKNMIFIFD